MTGRSRAAAILAVQLHRETINDETSMPARARARTCVTSIVEDNGARARAIVIAVVVGVGCTDVDYVVAGDEAGKSGRRAEYGGGRGEGRGTIEREREKEEAKRGVVLAKNGRGDGVRGGGEGADTVEAARHRGGGNMAVGQSVSNRRAVRSSLR